MHLEEIVNNANTDVSIDFKFLDWSFCPPRLDLFVPFMAALELEEHAIARTSDELPPDMPTAIATFREVNVTRGTRRTAIHDVA